MKVVVACILLILVGCRSNAPPDQATPAPGSTVTPMASPAAPSPCAVAGASQTAARNNATGDPGLLRDVRVSSTDCPRVVFEFENRTPSYVVEYRQPPFSECGSGEPISTGGWGATAYIVFHSNDASGVDLSGPTFRQTYTKSKDIQPSSRIVRRLRQTCDFEATLEWIVALDTRHPFKVSTLRSPPRLVIDISAAA